MTRCLHPDDVWPRHVVGTPNVPTGGDDGDDTTCIATVDPVPPVWFLVLGTLWMGLPCLWLVTP